MIKCLVSEVTNNMTFSNKVSARSFFKATSASKISYGLISKEIIFLPESY